MFLGTISPITMCRKVTMISAITRAIGWIRNSGTPTASNSGSIMAAIAGSPTEPMSSEQAVMPSWVAARDVETSSMPFSAMRAPREPSAARGSS